MFYSFTTNGLTTRKKGYSALRPELAKSPSSSIENNLFRDIHLNQVEDENQPHKSNLEVYVAGERLPISALVSEDAFYQYLENNLQSESAVSLLKEQYRNGVLCDITNFLGNVLKKQEKKLASSTLTLGFKTDIHIHIIDNELYVDVITSNLRAQIDEKNSDKASSSSVTSESAEISQALADRKNSRGYVHIPGLICARYHCQRKVKDGAVKDDVSSGGMRLVGLWTDNVSIKKILESSAKRQQSDMSYLFSEGGVATANEQRDLAGRVSMCIFPEDAHEDKMRMLLSDKDYLNMLVSLFQDKAACEALGFNTNRLVQINPDWASTNPTELVSDFFRFLYEVRSVSPDFVFPSKGEIEAVLRESQFYDANDFQQIFSVFDKIFSAASDFKKIPRDIHLIRDDMIKVRHLIQNAERDLGNLYFSLAKVRCMHALVEARRILRHYPGLAAFINENRVPPTELVQTSFARMAKLKKIEASVLKDISQLDKELVARHSKEGALQAVANHLIQRLREGTRLISNSMAVGNHDLLHRTVSCIYKDLNYAIDVFGYGSVIQRKSAKRVVRKRLSTTARLVKKLYNFLRGLLNLSKKPKKNKRSVKFQRPHTIDSILIALDQYGVARPDDSSARRSPLCVGNSYQANQLIDTLEGRLQKKRLSYSTPNSPLASASVTFEPPPALWSDKAGHLFTCVASRNKPNSYTNTWELGQLCLRRVKAARCGFFGAQVNDDRIDEEQVVIPASNGLQI